ncbi:MAG: NAD(P)/FAD-dependent oxidoreductase [Sulfurimonas sp.]|uniref:NAD(P)/FAD-dependent oxidoreductase n=1 Tax=Sulfurimonas sp. TaxID=2022749 RepID=UPI0025FD81C8|nr:NAD(P)/FAD-dependent oxidoreductase [Sulfurimonas sp.]MCK9491081.1 NAD(P)/FAD-dependent oxidoreductase [Sulfurimonas sp.]
MSKRVAIVGGGASGLLCSIECAKGSCKVDVFEQNDKCAKKILVSGNGRCNITNKNLTTHDFFGENPHFVKDAIEGFGYKEFTNFASSFGLILNTLDDGRAYPLSNESKSVASLLTTYATNLGVKIHTNTKIKDIKALLKNYDAVIVATGSNAAEHLGGCEDGYEFAKEFGHKIVQTYPSLVQLHLTSTIAHKMSGVKTLGEVTLLVNNKKDITICGDILFTNYGVSGFAILDISQRASKALLEFAKVDISINLLPSYNAQKLSTHIVNLSKSLPDLSVIEILIGLIPLKIAQAIIQTLEISQITKIDTKLSKRVANQILNWRFEVSNTHGFRHAEVSGGGVDTSEIDPKTFQSLKQKNLYFCGEVLDIVGKRGGYNFAFAWASGYLCAKDITKLSSSKIS